MSTVLRSPALTLPILLLALSGGGSPAAAEGRAPGGPYRPPVYPLSVIAAFDRPEARWLAGHRGIDVLAPAGSKVVAAGPGVVAFAGTVVDRGVVSIDHGTFSTTYEPVDASVTVGQTVAAGTVLGTLGTGAHCSLRCVHWGARIGEEYVDPLTLLVDYRPVLKTPLP